MMHETTSDCSPANEPRQGDSIRSNAPSWINFSIRCRWALLLLSALVIFALVRHAGAIQEGEEMLRARTIVAERLGFHRPGLVQAAALATRLGEEPQLSFHDHDGVSRLALGLSARYEPSAWFYGEKHDRRMDMNLDPDSFLPTMSMRDEGGESQIAVGVDRPGASLFFGRLDNPDIVLHNSTGFGPTLLLYDKRGKGRTLVSIRNNSEPFFELLDPDQNQVDRLASGVRGDGSPVLTSTDRASKVRLRISMEANGKSSLQFLDPKGAVTKVVTE